MIQDLRVPKVISLNGVLIYQENHNYFMKVKQKKNLDCQ